MGREPCMDRSPKRRIYPLRDLTMNPKEVVYRIFLKKNDGSLLEDLEIYRDGTWKALQVPTDDKSLEWFNLIENVRQICLENYKKGGVCIGPPDQFIPTNEKDADAFASLCSAYSHPKSLDLNECLDGYVVQYFGEGAPWKESDYWKNVDSEEVVY